MLPVTLALAFFSLLAAAAPSVEVEKRQGSVAALSSSTLAGFAPYTQFARAAYCDSSKVAKWSCGQACAALPGFQPTLTGGNGNDIQLFFVGYWPSQNTVVVGHQGTDPTQFESLLTDVNIPLRALSTSLFPGVSSSVQVHQGFADQHAKTASQILAEVKKLMSSKSTNKVTLIGHSLGGALAELDALFMKLQLPTAQIKAVTYGTPRVGNPAYAAYFNQQVPDFTRVNNRDDLIPIVPGRFLGFEHPAGQVHIIGDGNAVACAGDENEDDRCTDGAVENIFEGNIIDHLGPYEGIFIGTIFCN